MYFVYVLKIQWWIVALMIPVTICLNPLNGRGIQ